MMTDGRALGKRAANSCDVETDFIARHTVLWQTHITCYYLQ